MVGKSVACAVCLLPVLTGCAAVRNHAAEVRSARAELAAGCDPRGEAREAWQSVRRHYPRHAFTAEFHDGFIDGFAEYLECGEAAQPPSVPPLKSIRFGKYRTPEGRGLLRHYHLGFRYGSDVAIASGRREALVAPFPSGGAHHPGTGRTPGPPVVPFVPAPGGAQPLPPPRPAPEKKKKGSDDLPEEAGDLEPGHSETSIPLPRPELPVVEPFNPNWPGDKFAVPSNPDLLPVPDPPLPVPHVEPLPVPIAPRSTLPAVLEPPPPPAPFSMKVPIPAPPDVVPMLPVSVPTPAVLDDLPVIPFRYANPAPTPVSSLFPRK